MSINFLNIIQVLIAIALIGFILIQRGPGATAGSAFGGGGGGGGSGASGTVFGAKGSGSFLSKTTALLATAFFIITLLMAVDAKNSGKPVDTSGEQDLGVMGTLTEDQSGEVPSISGSIGDNSDVPAIEPTSQEVDPKLTEVNDQLKQIEENPAAIVDETTDDSGDKQ